MATRASPNIPGFYWDTEKCKYFRITPDHKAARGSAAARYTASVVSEKTALKAAHEQDREWSYRLEHETVRRSRIFTHGHAICMHREAGLHVTNDTHPAHFGLSGSESTFVHHFEHIAGHESHEARFVQTLARHRASGALFAGYQDSAVFRLLDEHSVAQRPYRNPYKVPIKRIMFAHRNSDLLIFLHSCGIVSTFLPTPDHQVHHPGHFSRGRWNCHAPTEEIPTFDAARQPDSGQPMILIGSHRLRLYDVTRCEFVHRVIEKGRQSDILSVQWQTSNITTWGKRNGTVSFGDIRTNGEVVTRIKHPSSAVQLQYADTSGSSPRIVVAGLQNHLGMYDLRYCKRYETKPWLEYSGYENRSNPMLGFDVHPMLGIVAAARDRGGIAVMNLWKGMRLESDGAFNTTIRQPVLGKRKQQLHTAQVVVAPDNLVGCIKFEKDEEESMDGVGYCLIGDGPHVRRCIWGRVPPKLHDKAVKEISAQD